MNGDELMDLCAESLQGMTDTGLQRVVAHAQFVAEMARIELASRD
jgi:hypothetical protein